MYEELVELQMGVLTELIDDISWCVDHDDSKTLDSNLAKRLHLMNVHDQIGGWLTVLESVDTKIQAIRYSKELEEI